MDPALGPDVLAEHQHARIGFELLLDHPADGGDHVDALTGARRHIRGRRRLVAAVPQASDLLQLAVVEDLARDFFGWRNAARLGLGYRSLDLPFGLPLEARPLL